MSEEALSSNREPQQPDDPDQHRSFSGLHVDIQDWAKLPDATKRVLEAARRARARGGK